jgi:hypothetical protein
MFLERVRETLSDGVFNDRVRSVIYNPRPGDPDPRDPGPPDPGDPGDPETPPAPTGLVATGEPAAILLQWNQAEYRGHMYTEVWAADIDDRGQALSVGMAPGPIFSHAVGPLVGKWYWIRFVNTNGVAGPFNAQNGTYGESLEGYQLPEPPIDDLDNSDLNKILDERLAWLEDPTFGLRGEAARIRGEFSALLNGALDSIQEDLDTIRDELSDILVTEQFDPTSGYSVGDLVIWLNPSTGTSYIYQCKQDIPVPVPPATAPLPSDTDYWNQVGDSASIAAIVDDIAAAGLLLQARGEYDGDGNVVSAMAAALLDVRSVLEDEDGNLLTAGALLALTSRVSTAEGKITALATAMIEAGVLVQQPDGTYVTSTAFLTLIARIEQLSSNLLGNSEFMQADKAAEDEWPNEPPESWTLNSAVPLTVGTNFDVRSSPASSDGVRALFVRTAAPMTIGQTIEIIQENVPITAGGRYQASIYAGSPLSAVKARISIVFRSASADLETAATADTVLTKSGLGPNSETGSSLVDYQRLFIFGTAPASAVSARIKITLTPGTVNPGHFYATRPFFGTATTDQDTPSPWVPGIQGNAYRAAAAAALALDLSYRQPDGPWATSNAFLQLKGQIDDTGNGLIATNAIALGVQSVVEDPETGLAAIAGALDSLRTEVELGPNSLTALAARISAVAATIGNNGANLLEDIAFGTLGYDTDGNDETVPVWTKTGSLGWAAATYGVNAAGYVIPRIAEKVMYISSAGTPVGGSAVVYQDIPVTPGQWYQFNAWAKTSKCSARLTLRFLTSAKVLISPDTSVTAPAAVGPGTVLSGYVRAHVAKDAPATAAFARVMLVAENATGSAPAAYFVRPFFGEAEANQAEPSPWLPPLVDAFTFQEMVADVYDDETGLGALGTLIQGVDSQINDPETGLSAVAGAFNQLKASTIALFENRLIRSEEFATGWGRTAVTVTTDASAVPGFEGTPAEAVREQATIGQHCLVQGAVPVEQTFNHTISVYAKAVNGRHLVIRAVTQTGEVNNATCFFTFNLSTGVYVGSSGIDGAIGWATAVGDGWYRCWGSFKVPKDAIQMQVGLFIAPSATNYTSAPSYSGSTTAGLDLFGAQVNAGSRPDGYRKTTDQALYGSVHDRLRAVSSAITAVDARLTDPETGEVFSAGAFSILNAQVNGEGGLAEAILGLQAGIGQGGNLLRDTTFQFGENIAWRFATSSAYSYAVNLSGYTLSDDGSENVPYIFYSGTVDAASAAYGNIIQDEIQVEPGKYYQVSAYVGVHRTQAVIIVQFLSSTGAVVGSFTSRPISQVSISPYSGLGGLAQFGRLFGVSTTPAPGTAVTARVYIRSRFVGSTAYSSNAYYLAGDVVLSGSTLYTCKLDTPTLPAPPVTNTTYWTNNGPASNIANSYMFIARPFFGTAKEGQTEPSDWAKGLEPNVFAALQEKGIVWADRDSAGAMYTLKLRAKDEDGAADAGFGLAAVKENGKWISDVRFSANRFALMDPAANVNATNALDWAPDTRYELNELARYYDPSNNALSGVYRCIFAHTSGATPNLNYWAIVAKYPFVYDSGIVYLDTAVIRDASIGTLMLDGEVVTVPRYITNQNANQGNNSWIVLAAQKLTIVNPLPTSMRVMLLFSARQDYTAFSPGTYSPGTGFAILQSNNGNPDYVISSPAGQFNIPLCVQANDYLVWTCEALIAPNSTSSFTPQWYAASNTIWLRQKAFMALGVKR